MDNYIEVSFGALRNAKTRPVFLVDHGMVLKFKNLELPQSYEVHFSNDKTTPAKTSIGDENGVVIPDEYFHNAERIYAWLYLHNGESGYTAYEVEIPLRQRSEVSDIEPTPQQETAIEQAITALNAAVTQTAADVVATGRDAQAAERAAETAVAKAALAGEAAGAAETAQGKAEDAADDAEDSAGEAAGYASDASGYATAAESAASSAQEDADFLRNASAVAESLPVGSSPEVNLEDGVFTFGMPLPADGDDGYSPTIGVSDITGGHRVTVTDKNGTRTFDVMDGEDGDDGVSPTITVTSITGGHRVTITDATGTQTFDVMDGQNPSDLDAGDIAYDGTETYPADTVGAEISTVKSAIDSTESNLVWRLDWANAVELVAEQTVSFALDSDTNLYKHSGNLTGINWSTEFENNSETNAYAVTWDGTETALVMWMLAEPTSVGASYGKYLGNMGLLGFRDPYAVSVPYVFQTISATAIFTSSTAASHTISIKRIPVVFGPVHKQLKTLVSKGTGDASVTIGEEACDADDYGIAIGYAARAGQGGVASGIYSGADGMGSAAIGFFARASGIAAMAIGYGTNAASEGQVVLGYYNVIDNNGDYALILGDGDDNTRHNLLTVDKNGIIVSGGSQIARKDEPSIAVSGTTPTIAAVAGNRYVCGKVATLTITVPASGIIDVVFTSGSTPTVLTVTPPTGMTMSWANGFDPTSLEANTTYELNIADGCLGVAGAWT